MQQLDSLHMIHSLCRRNKQTFFQSEKVYRMLQILRSFRRIGPISHNGWIAWICHWSSTHQKGRKLEDGSLPCKKTTYNSFFERLSKQLLWGIYCFLGGIDQAARFSFFDQKSINDKSMLATNCLEGKGQFFHSIWYIFPSFSPPSTGIPF